MFLNVLLLHYFENYSIVLVIVVLVVVFMMVVVPVGVMVLVSSFNLCYCEVVNTWAAEIGLNIFLIANWRISYKTHWRISTTSIRLLTASTWAPPKMRLLWGWIIWQSLRGCFLLSRPPPLCRHHRNHRKRAGVGFEVVHHHLLQGGPHFQHEHLRPSLLHAVGTRVDGGQGRNITTSPHIHKTGLLEMGGNRRWRGSDCRIGSGLAHRRGTKAVSCMWKSSADDSCTSVSSSGRVRG